MNRGKHARVRALVHARRGIAVLHGREQWRRFFELGQFAARLKSRTGCERVDAAFRQMFRHQFVGALNSFFWNWREDFHKLVNR